MSGRVMSGRVIALSRHSFVRFAVIGIFSYLVDLGSLVALHSVLGVELIAATVVAYALGFLVNFGLNRAFSFGNADAPVGPQLAKYGLLVAVNLLFTVLIVDGLTHVWQYYAGSKTIASILNSGMNYAAYRFWVFRTPQPDRTAARTAIRLPGRSRRTGEAAPRPESRDVGEEVA